MIIPILVYSILLVFLGCTGQEQQLELKKNNAPLYVRVLLEGEAVPENISWQFLCPNGFVVIDPDEAEVKKGYRSDKLTVTMTPDALTINGKPTHKKQLYIVPYKGHLGFKEKSYDGFFYITMHKGSLILINVIDLEEYVYSVLKTESWPGWPLEVNKAFAIASRTYVVGVIMRDKGHKKPYHVKSTNSHQTYTGIHVTSKLRQAVDQTRGIFLAHNKKPIIAMFDICCGGVINADRKGMNFQKAPYLARSYPCHYCKKAKVFSWEVEYEIAALEAYLQPALPNVRKIKEVKISKKDKAGIAHELTIKDAHGHKTVTGKKFYSMLKKELKSFCYTISKKAQKIIVKGKGFGHHWGLCQWGARYMVDEGFDYKKILTFYYPGVTFMRLQGL